MTVKELKDFLDEHKDEQEIIFQSGSGIEWEALVEDSISINQKYKKKPKMYVRVK